MFTGLPKKYTRTKKKRWVTYKDSFKGYKPRPGGSVVSVSDSRPGGCECDPRVRRPFFFLAYFRLSPIQNHLRKVVGCFGK